MILGRNFSRGELAVLYFHSCSCWDHLKAGSVAGVCLQKQQKWQSTQYLVCQPEQVVKLQLYLAPTGKDIVHLQLEPGHTHTGNASYRQSASEHLTQCVLHRGLSIGFLHRKEYTQSRSLNFLLSMQQSRRNFYNKFISLVSLKKVPKTYYSLVKM